MVLLLHIPLFESHVVFNATSLQLASYPRLGWPGWPEVPGSRPSRQHHLPWLVSGLQLLFPSGRMADQHGTIDVNYMVLEAGG
jgi:hypothetical protein